MKKLMLIVAAVCLLTAGVALAQVEEEEQIIYKKVTHLPFVTTTIVGNTVGPENSYLPVKKGAQFELLIPVRDNFLPEMMKTVSSL